METAKLQSLEKNIRNINQLIKSFGVPEKVLEREVKTFGNGSHVILPKEHLNKRVRIIVG